MTRLLLLRRCSVAFSLCIALALLGGVSPTASAQSDNVGVVTITGKVTVTEAFQKLSRAS